MEVLSKIPKDILRWLTGKVEVRPGRGVSRVYFQGDRYILEVDQGLAPQYQVGVFFHELAHLVRGDLMKATSMGLKEQDWRLWNIATDAVINERLREVYALPEGAIYHRDFQGAPPLGAGAEVLFRWLKDRNQDQEDFGQGQDQGRGAGDLGPLDPGDLEKAKRVWRRIIATAPNGLPGVELPSIRTEVTKPMGYTLPPLAPFLSRVLQAARGGGSVRLYRRTYARPGRMPYLRGVHRPWSGRIVLALDASGSMDKYTPTYLALTEALGRSGLIPERWVWADRASPWPEGAEMPAVGWGTQLSPLLKALQASPPDALVIFTDGEIADPERAARAAQGLEVPIFWVLVEGGEAPFPGEATFHVQEAHEG